MVRELVSSVREFARGRLVGDDRERVAGPRGSVRARGPSDQSHRCGRARLLERVPELVLESAALAPGGTGREDVAPPPEVVKQVTKRTDEAPLSLHEKRKLKDRLSTLMKDAEEAKEEKAKEAEEKA